MYPCAEDAAVFEARRKHENTALRLLLRVSLSMPEREAQGKYVPCENASGAGICYAWQKRGTAESCTRTES